MAYKWSKTIHTILQNQPAQRYHCAIVLLIKLFNQNEVRSSSSPNATWTLNHPSNENFQPVPLYVTCTSSIELSTNTMCYNHIYSFCALRFYAIILCKAMSAIATICYSCLWSSQQIPARVNKHIILSYPSSNCHHEQINSDNSYVRDRLVGWVGFNDRTVTV